MIRNYGNSVPFGLAAYNAGPHRLLSFAQGRPEVANLIKNRSSEPFDEIWFDELPWLETSIYVKSILRNTLMYKALEKGKIKLDAVLWRDLTQELAKGPEQE